MNTGQTMLAVGAMMLLSFLVLRFNSVHITSAQASYNAKFGIVATSLANSLIEEAKDKAFDELVLDTTKTILSANDFSSILNKETGEVYPDFDDFDDYNNLFYLDSLSLKDPQTGLPTKFEIRSKVNYVTDVSPDVNSASRQYHKKITVAVYCSALVDTIRLSSIFSFWTLLE
ncbi:MAG: hypothetical protein WAR59_00915 [Ignavibacteriaceae bacterium]|jgi:hypothetical protein